MEMLKRFATLLHRPVVTASFLLFLAGVSSIPVCAQALAVLPVSIHLTSDQLASTVTVANQGPNETAVQVRVYAWSQTDGEDKLTPTDNVLVSPPIATIAPGGTQIVRVVLRKHPQDREATYRIILDQIPPPAEPGVVRVVLKLSLPIFAQPINRTSPQLRFHAERTPEKLFLVATNDGTRHEAVRDIVLATHDGHPLKVMSSLPYVLAGSTRRWEVALPEAPLKADEPLKLTAHEDAKTINQPVPFADAP